MHSLLTVTNNEEVAQDIYQMTLKGKQVQEMQYPGQFVHIRVDLEGGPLLRRPLSICDVDQERQEMTVIYRAQGEGTNRLAKKKEGEPLDVLGPLGHPFPLNHMQEHHHAILVGGGVGVPPLYYLSKELIKRGVKVTHILGFQSAAQVFLYEEFNRLGETYVTTMDGSFGQQGLVTDILDQWSTDEWDGLYSCGPIPMLKALATRFEGHPHAYLSLEERMGCGIGACFACVCHVPHSETDYKKVCTDGPVFRVGEVQL